MQQFLPDECCKQKYETPVIKMNIITTYDLLTTKLFFFRVNKIYFFLPIFLLLFSQLGMFFFYFRIHTIHVFVFGKCAKLSCIMKRYLLSKVEYKLVYDLPYINQQKILLISCF